MKLNTIAIMEVNEFRSLLSNVVCEQLQEFKKNVFSLIDKRTIPDEYLTRKEAADFLKISITTLWGLDKSQQLPAKRLNGKVLYLKSDLLTFLNEAA